MSSVNPRVGRSGNLLFALFAFVVYYNLLNLGQSWVGSRPLGIGGFLLVLHGGAFAARPLLWLAKQHNNWGCARRARRRRQRRATHENHPPPDLRARCLKAVAFVTLGFLACSSSSTSSTNCPTSASAATALRLPQALLYVALLLPSHLYELLPIAVLIGTIFVMARLAQSSEYTILRTSGLGPVARAAHAAAAGRWSSCC